jgi:hypothetical protein
MTPDPFDLSNQTVALSREKPIETPPLSGVPLRLSDERLEWRGYLVK